MSYSRFGPHIYLIFHCTNGTIWSRNSQLKVRILPLKSKLLIHSESVCDMWIFSGKPLCLFLFGIFRDFLDLLVRRERMVMLAPWWETFPLPVNTFRNSLISSQHGISFCRALLVPLVLEVRRVQVEPMYVWLIYAPINPDIKRRPWKLNLDDSAVYLFTSVRDESSFPVLFPAAGSTRSSRWCRSYGICGWKGKRSSRFVSVVLEAHHICRLTAGWTRWGWKPRNSWRTWN